MHNETRGPGRPPSSPSGAPAGALAGMRVIELSQIMAGPTCGMVLADLGADVIKVEKIDGGDDSRQYRDPQINGISAPYLMLNRNKRAIALDLKHPEGKKVLLRMIRDADVVTENFRKGTMEKLGLGYDTLRKENPGLIYCAVSGYGTTGPYADKGGFDLVAQGFSGLMAITGERRSAAAHGELGGRHQRRPARGVRRAGGVSAQTAHGRRPDRRDLATGSEPAAAVLARRDLFRQRRVARSHGVGACAQRPIPGVSHGNRLDHHRRGEREKLAAHCASAGQARMGRRPALRAQPGPHAEPG